MSNAISGVGTTFARSDMASSPAFTDIAEVNNIDGPNMSKDSIDVTSLDSTGGYREFIGGFRDGGTVTLTMNFTNAGYTAMKADFESDTLTNYKITLPDVTGTTLTILGDVTELGMAIPTDDKVTAPVTIKVSGPTVLGP